MDVFESNTTLLSNYTPMKNNLKKYIIDTVYARKMARNSILQLS